MRAISYRRILGRVLPRRCALCGTRITEHALCEGCLDDLPVIASPRCVVCAAPSPGGSICGSCLKSPPRFDETRVGSRYAFPVDSLVRSLKYRGALAEAGALAEVLARALWGSPRPDLVVPVPLSPARERERGFNQALEIARCLPSPWLDTVEDGVIARTRETPPQAALPLAERATNVRGGFEARRELSGLTVAVVDDVMTSGATLDAVADALKRAGARRVVNWVVARTPAPGE